MDSLALDFTQYSHNFKNYSGELVVSNRYPSSACSFSFSLPPFSQRLKLRGNSPIVAAAKKDGSKRRKDDSHSFVSKPDESIGPFPEAVLLKQRKVEEDGRLMPEFEDVEERELFEALNLELESDMYTDQMRHYEVVYLIHEDHKEEVENVNMKVQEFLKEKKGRVWRFNDWGMRRLAYKIQKAKNAHYILMNFEIEAKWINDFKTMLDKDERVIRHLVMKQKKAETSDCPPPPEFHTMNENGEVVEYDDDEDEDDEDWDDEDGGVIYVDDEGEKDNNKSEGRSKQETQKVGR